MGFEMCVSGGQSSESFLVDHHLLLNKTTEEMTLSFTQRIFVEPMTNVQANITCNIYIQPSLKAELPISLQHQCNDNNNDNDDDNDNPTLPNVEYIILKLSHVLYFS